MYKCISLYLYVCRAIYPPQRATLTNGITKTAKKLSAKTDHPVVVDGCLNLRKKGDMQTIQHEPTPPHSQPHPQPLKT